MSLVKFRERFLNDVKTNSLPDTIYDIVYRGVNRFSLLMVLKCLSIDTVDHKYLKGCIDYRCEFLDHKTLLRLSENPEYQIDRDFLNEAFRKGDECFAILDEDRLASYGWYATKPTLLNKDLELQFDERRVYMYNGFTHPNYRGKRLHAIGMTMALDHYLNHGYMGIVSWVEANNNSSLKSCYRMGYKDFGEVFILKLLSKYIILYSKGCKDYKFNVSVVN